MIDEGYVHHKTSNAILQITRQELCILAFDNIYDTRPQEIATFLQNLQFLLVGIGFLFKF